MADAKGKDYSWNCEGLKSAVAVGKEAQGTELVAALDAALNGVRADVAGRVGKAAGTAVLSVGLANSIFQGDLEVTLPQTLPRPHLDGRDDELSPLQSGLVVRVRLDLELRFPLAVEPLRQPPDDLLQSFERPPEDPLPSDLGRASLTVRAFSCRAFPLRAAIAAWASDLEGISTKAKPFERPESRSTMVFTETTFPCAWKRSLRPASLVS